MSVRSFRILLLVSSATLLAAVFWLLTASPAQAQCGSQASSCKNCHEVKAQKSVNSDGTNWHEKHAFGDFCANCHAGNVQAQDKAAAHTGMVAPLSDLKANCGSCHAKDLQARGGVYAKALGVTLTGAGASQPPSGGNSTGGSAGANPPASGTQPPAAPVVVNDAGVVDYAQRYDQRASGAFNLNWGDVILGVLLVVVALGGGLFVYWNESRLGKAGAPRLAAAPAGGGPVDPAACPADVLALLPRLARLDPAGLFALKRLLEKPEDASELLQSLSRLDPDLVRRIRNLDRDSRALLLGLTGN
jgi:hypothetical protein